MVLRDAEDNDGDTAKEEEQGSNAGRSDGENRPERYRSKRPVSHGRTLLSVEGQGNLRDLQLANKTDSTKATANRIEAVEEKRRCSDGCKKSLYGARLTIAIFAISHDRAKKSQLVGRHREEGRRLWIFVWGVKK